MRCILSCALRYLILALGAVYIVLVYVLPSPPKTTVGWAWLLGFSLPFVFGVGVVSQVIFRYRPPNKLLQFFVISLACAILLVFTFVLLYLVGIIV